ncbi:hypothetical protein BDW74DRAFT_185040 [Aspergillus multicolor]|uniref:uncharacterized protein n=1 Tax=Aspergillus multicolor TaxID=41759 RepID=UPI003CCD70C9
MKRKQTEIPADMVHRWGRAPLSCHLCRTKKLRCDRGDPCSNCAQRKIDCIYSGQGSSASGRSRTPTANATKAQNLVSGSRPLRFGAPISPESSLAITPTLDLPLLRIYLPPLEQGMELFNHFAQCLQPTFGVLHLPSTRSLVDQVYQVVLNGEEPDLAGLALVYAIFAGAALAWTADFLETLHASREEAKTAFSTYSRLALLILDDHQEALPLSTVALEALCTLGHVLAHTDGFSHKVQTLRMRQLLMARTLQIHRLDSAKCIEERRLKGSNSIETEVQRRIWWHMVASDWLSALSSSPQEGTYLLQPKHMNVNRPSNADDEFISAPGSHYGFPLSIPTSMSAFLYRVHLAELCREIVDLLPSGLFESPEIVCQEVDYSIILELDKRIQTTLSELPIFFKLDSVSVQQSLAICHQRPYIACQRTFLHFSINTRICRLHRPFHLDGFANPQYAYSTMTCVRSAETVLNLGQSLDDVGALIGFNPSRFWIAVQHIYQAAIILATEVSMDPQAPEAAARKEKVLAACRMLEQSQHESEALKEAIQKNTNTLRMILQSHSPLSNDSPVATGNQRKSPLGDRIRTSESVNLPHAIDGQYLAGPSSTTIANSAEDVQEVPVPTLYEWSDTSQDQQFNDGTWGKLWSDIFDLGLDLDAPHWNSILGDLDFTGNSVGSS